MASSIPAFFEDAASCCALVGNCLLSPLGPGDAQLLQGSLWRELAAGTGDEASRAALLGLAEAASSLEALGPEQALETLAVCHAKLFVGPGTPAAPPWETYYRGGGKVVFGQATVEMQRQLAAWGLKVDNADRQMADHIGIELLLVSAVCRRAARGELSGAELGSLAELVERHPLAWMGELGALLAREDSTGFYSGLLAWAEAQLRAHPCGCPTR